MRVFSIGCWMEHCPLLCAGSVVVAGGVSSSISRAPSADAVAFIIGTAVVVAISIFIPVVP
eukprot:11001521-Ditylum_brightwellii.AAC.1